MKHGALHFLGLFLVCLHTNYCKNKNKEPAPINFQKHQQEWKKAPSKDTTSESQKATAPQAMASSRAPKQQESIEPTSRVSLPSDNPSLPFTPGQQSLVEKIKAESAQEANLPTVMLADSKLMSKGSAVNLGTRLFKRAYRLALQKQYHEAQTIYLQACQYGHKESCHKFGYYQQKEGNFANAIRFYKIGCNAGILKSCNNLGFGMEKSGNIESAKDYYSLACLRHHYRSCQNLTRVLNHGKNAYSQIE